MEKPDSFFVYNASAGSGKTFALVQNYLSLLFTSERHDSYRNILAITFTNKAVEEMKTRIIDSLTAFCRPVVPEKSKALLNAIMTGTGLSEEKIRGKSKNILKSIVHNYTAFEVSTIDSFTNRVIRTFAKDLGLSSNFQVELDVNSVLMEAVDRLIAHAGENQKLTKTLIDFAISKADEDKSWDISRDLYTIAKLLPNENNYLPLEKLRAKSLQDFYDFALELKKEIAQREQDLERTAENFFGLLLKNGLENTDFSASYVPKYFLKFQQRNFDPGFTAKWQETIADKNLYPQKTPQDKKNIIDQLQPHIAELFQTSKTLVLERKFYVDISKNLTQLSLLNAIQQEVIEIKNERNILLISDFNKEIGASVKDQPVPFIYERLGTRFRDYFIDEFQDTSVLQWENLIPLVDNTLSSFNEHGKPGTLTLVGDAKQAIYRWRGGKSEQFMDLYGGKSPFSIAPKNKTLEDNYRSKKEIVDFNNSFFTYISRHLGLETHQELYENARQNSKKETGGYVNISFVEAKNQAEKDIIYPEKTLEIIQKLETNGYPKSDICILVRKKKEGIAVANFLAENEIPIISSETLLLARSAEVGFVANLFAYSINPENQTLQLELLSFLWDHFPLETERHQFLSMGLQAGGTGFFDFLKEYGFHFQLPEFLSLPLYNAAEYILRSFRLTEKVNAYLQSFLDLVYEYQQNHNKGISGFLEHWQQNLGKLSIDAPEGENAVRIMTIHRSKGLEFPIVIYPFAEESFKDTKQDNLWIPLEAPFNAIPYAYIGAKKALLDYQKNASDEYENLLIQKELDTLNLLYVTCTRPKQQLYIISEWAPIEKVNKEKKSISHFFIDYLENLKRWDDAKFTYDFGEFLPNPDPPSTTEIDFSMKKFISTPPSSHNLNIVSRSGRLWETEQEKAIAQGDILHEIISFINTAPDIEDALVRAVNNGTITPHELDFQKKALLRITEHPDLKKYFSPQAKSFNEKEILDAGEILRPDRINFRNGEASIIDYKTGKTDPKHTLQINRYAQAVENLGYRVSEKLLVYINDEVTVKIV